MYTNTTTRPFLLLVLVLFGWTSAAQVAALPKKKETYWLPACFPLRAHEFQTVSSPFGYRMHPIHKQHKLHAGIDLVAPKGAAVLATAAGVVAESSFERGYGNYIAINHKANLKTVYAHLWVNLVKKGDTISQGQPIGMVGDTGRATGPHLHYEVRINNKKIDPVRFWKMMLKANNKKKA